MLEYDQLSKIQKHQKTLGNQKKRRLSKRTFFFERAGKKHTKEDPGIYMYMFISWYLCIPMSYIYIYYIHPIHGPRSHHGNRGSRVLEMLPTRYCQHLRSGDCPRRIIPGLGYVVNNHGDRVRPLRMVLWDPSKWPDFMAYKWG